MIARIRTLPPLVANQIAAGEVIERPASVVKELLENAVDAKATTIHLEFMFGGLNQIKISDNGCGILAEDLPLAIVAHATSKISVLDDLYSIASMGFRGEALASIAAVSRLLIQSKPLQQAHAMTLRIDEHGSQLSPSARSEGTTIEVRDLFYNTPVRKKFLKSAQLEYQAIETVIKRFSLSVPQVMIAVKQDDKPVFTLPPANSEHQQRQRVQKIMGKTFMAHAIYIEVERAGMRLQGWISSPAYQRSQNDKQWIYINQRMVKDKLLQHALKQSYDGLLHPGRHPACVLYLTLSPAEMDVNVHPTKHEVRFQQPRLVHDFIVSQITQALGQISISFSDTLLASKLSLNEPSIDYVPPPPQPMAISSTSWLSLDAHYAIVLLSPKQPFLIDVVSILQEKIYNQLAQQPLPFAHRALLVPVSYALDKQQKTILTRLLPYLIQFGLEFSFLSDSHVTLRTVPEALPLLNVELLLQRMVEIEFEQAAVLKLLIACQTVSALQLSPEEKTTLMIYLQHHPTTLSTWGVELNHQRCRAFIHG